MGRVARLAAVLALAIASAGAGQPPRTISVEPEWLTGQLLVATEDLRDPRFHHTVIYMVRHDRTGAMGLVVNRPLGDVGAADLLEKLGRKTDGVSKRIRVHYGGPVESGRGFVLHAVEAPAGSGRAPDGIALSTDPAVLEEIARGAGPRRSVFALGYAGWAPGQLEGEIERGSWISVAADEALIFDDDTDSKWERAMASRRILL